MEIKELKQLIINKSVASKLASRKLAGLSSDQKNKILLAMADAITKQKDEILFRNEIDVEAAKE